MRKAFALMGTVMVLGLALAGCPDPTTAPAPWPQPLAAPNISLVGSVVSWGEVAGAGGFSVRIGGVQVTGGALWSLARSFDLADLGLGTGSHVVTVVAIHPTDPSLNSLVSNAVTFIVEAVFVPVTGITGVQTVATAGMPLALSGTVTPANATNSTIVWSVGNAGTTGAEISGGALHTSGAGTATVRATIANGASATTNFVRDFTITVNATFVPVTGITDVPTAATAGEPLALSGTVTPSNATNSTIVWSVGNAGTTGATIASGDTLYTSAAGTATVRATIAGGMAPETPFTMDFPITVNAAFVPVTGITGVPTVAIAGEPLALSGTVTPSNATNSTIAWSVLNAGTTGAAISDGTLNTSAAGTATVRATIAGGTAPETPFTMDFPITVNAAFVPVTGITGVPTVATAGEPLALSGTVTPSNATNSAIVWTIQTPGTTGATIANGTLHTTNAGTATIRATIANGASAMADFTQDFPITVDVAFVFVPVTGVTEVPTTTTAGEPLALSGTVTPANATNSTIVWSVLNTGTTGATITGNTLHTTGAGTATVRATIANGASATTDFTQDFPITIDAAFVFVPVTGITGVPTVAIAGTSLAMSGTATPANATNSEIVWTVQTPGTTGATIANGTLHTTNAGTATIRATIANGASATADFTQDFAITVDAAFVPVTGITGVPTTATAGEPLALSGTVTPSNATNSEIVWSVLNTGTTGATIANGTLHTSGAGTATIRATIANGSSATTDFTQDFAITVDAAFVPVTGITGVPTTATAGEPLALSGTVTPSNATNSAIAWTVQTLGTTGATIANGTLHTTGAGTATIRATIANGASATADFTQDFTVTVAPPPPGEGDFTIGFGTDIQVEIVGPTIRLRDNPEDAPRITVLNPEQFDAYGIEWFVGETRITGGAVSGSHGQTLALDSRVHNNQTGTHRITVEVRRNGVLHSKTIVVSVTL